MSLSPTAVNRGRHGALPEHVTVFAIAAAVVYGWHAAASHLSLLTNAYDLSFFDYALWTTAHGRLGYVPFVGHSTFSEHCMPILLVLLPIYVLLQSPWTLIGIQVLTISVSSWVIGRIANLYLSRTSTNVILLTAIIFSRKSYGAFTSVFYPECFQPLFVAGCVWAWLRSYKWMYWTCVLLLLATKEDAAIYLAMFGLVQWCVAGRVTRTTAFATVGVSALWFIVAVGIVIPAMRRSDGLPGAKQFIEARYGNEHGLESHVLVSRILSKRSASTCFNLLATFGFLSLAAPEWLVIIAPGLLANVAANPDTLQAAVAGHYYWPFFPWLALSAIVGASRLQRRYPTATKGWMYLLLLLVVVDSPIFPSVARFRIDPRARRVAESLPKDVAGLTIGAQPNLVPHLPHSWSIRTIGRDPLAPEKYDLVLLTPVGDTWPFSVEQINAKAAEYKARADYESLSLGQLFSFRRR